MKKNFLAGLELVSLPALNTAARHWVDTVANLRLHGETHRHPIDLFAEEKLLPLHPHSYGPAPIEDLRASSRFRITVDANTYSVPARYARQVLQVHIYPERILIYHHLYALSGLNRVAPMTCFPQCVGRQWRCFSGWDKRCGPRGNQYREPADSYFKLQQLSLLPLLS